MYVRDTKRGVDVHELVVKELVIRVPHQVSSPLCFGDLVLPSIELDGIQVAVVHQCP